VANYQFCVTTHAQHSSISTAGRGLSLRLPRLFLAVLGICRVGRLVQLLALIAPHRLQPPVVHDTTLVEHFNQALNQRVIAVRGFRLAQKQLESLLEPLSQTGERVFEHREPFEQMLFVRSGGRHINAQRRRLHDNHQAGATTLAKLLAQRISRTALLTKMGNRALH
jgi:hypothetical protein